MNLCLVKRLNLEKSKNKLKTRAWVDVVWFSLAIRREQLTAETRGFLENLKIFVFLTEKAEIAEGDVGADGARDDHADEDHDLLPVKQQLDQSCLGF